MRTCQRLLGASESCSTCPCVFEYSIYGRVVVVAKRGVPEYYVDLIRRALTTVEKRFKRTIKAVIYFDELDDYLRLGGATPNDTGMAFLESGVSRIFMNWHNWDEVFQLKDTPFEVVDYMLLWGAIHEFLHIILRSRSEETVHREELRMRHPELSEEEINEAAELYMKCRALSDRWYKAQSKEEKGRLFDEAIMYVKRHDAIVKDWEPFLKLKGREIFGVL